MLSTRDAHRSLGEVFVHGVDGVFAAVAIGTDGYRDGVQAFHNNVMAIYKIKQLLKCWPNGMCVCVIMHINLLDPSRHIKSL